MYRERSATMLPPMAVQRMRTHRLGQTDRLSDRPTDGSPHCVMPPYQRAGGVIISLNMCALVGWLLRAVSISEVNRFVATTFATATRTYKENWFCDAEVR